MRRDVLSESVAPSSSSVEDECRRLAELLRLDAVGVIHGMGSERRMRWWVEPGSAPLPHDVEDILGRLVDGWIVHPISEDALVLGRTTPETSARATTVLGSVGASLADRLASERGAPASTPPSHEDAGSDPGHGRGGQTETRGRRGLLQAELADLCRIMGFDSAGLFVPHAGRGWQLAARSGPERPWHSILDPGAAGPLGAGLVFAEARPMPGVGPRLAALGCGAVAFLPVAGGARVVLDADTVRRGTPGVDHAADHLKRIGELAGDAGSMELRVVERLGRRIRETLDDLEADVPQLLEILRSELGADEVFHLVERGGGVEVVSAPADDRRFGTGGEGRTDLKALPSENRLDEATTSQLGLIVGASSATLSAAFAHDSPPREALIAGWRTGPGLSPEAMRVVAEVIGTARSVIESRRHAVEALMTRERNRWAYEIHDGLTQAVTTAVLELEALGRQIEQDPKGAVQALATTRAEIRKSLSQVRGMLYELHGDERPAPHMGEPLTKYVNDVARRWRLPARVAVSGDLQRVPKHVLGVAYVVIREALANAAKHAAAGAVTVSVTATPDQVTVEVGDTGRGFDPRSGPAGGPRRNFGLEMVDKRVAEVGGTMTVHSAPGQGTRVVAELPVEEGER